MSIKALSLSNTNQTLFVIRPQHESSLLFSAASLALIAVMVSSLESTAPEVKVDAEGHIGFYAAKKSHLYVKLSRATNLRNKDWIGKLNPFVEM